MSIFTIAVLILVFAAPFTYYYYLDAKRKKAVQAERKFLMVRSEKMKADFKAETQQLVTRGVLSSQMQEDIYRIANYYFVFQPVTTKNMEHCEQLLHGLFSAVNDKLNSSASSTVFVRELLSHFVGALPRIAGGYDANFYRNVLPGLIYNLANTKENTAKESHNPESSDPCVDGENGIEEVVA